jgi:hypothetical protein
MKKIIAVTLLVVFAFVALPTLKIEISVKTNNAYAEGSGDGH